jgi:hypothetical protein
VKQNRLSAILYHCLAQSFDILAVRNIKPEMLRQPWADQLQQLTGLHVVVCLGHAVGL